MASAGSSRRRFLKTSAAGVSATLLPAASWGRVLGANDRLNMAVIGTGGMGTGHTQRLVDRKQAENIDVIGTLNSAGEEHKGDEALGGRGLDNFFG